jgi:hypothetical protein
MAYEILFLSFSIGSPVQYTDIDNIFLPYNANQGVQVI